MTRARRLTVAALSAAVVLAAVAAVGVAGWHWQRVIDSYVLTNLVVGAEPRRIGRCDRLAPAGEPGRIPAARGRSRASGQRGARADRVVRRRGGMARADHPHAHHRVPRGLAARPADAVLGRAPALPRRTTPVTALVAGPGRARGERRLEHRFRRALARRTRRRHRHPVDPVDRLRRASCRRRGERHRLGLARRDRDGLARRPLRTRRRRDQAATPLADPRGAASCSSSTCSAGSPGTGRSSCC